MFEIVLRRATASSLSGSSYGVSSFVEEWRGDEALFVGGEAPTDAALYWRLDLGSFTERAVDLLETAVPERGLPWVLKVSDESLILVVTPDAAALPEWVARFEL